MFRKLALRMVLLVLMLVPMVMPGVVNADASTDGCYISTSASTVKEDETFTVTVECANIPISNNVFGFQISTARSGDFVVADVPTSYTPGEFTSSASPGVVVGENLLAGLYAVSRQGSDVVTETSFTLGSYTMTAEDNLTTDGSITLTFTDADFMLSDNYGAELTSWLRTVNDVTVTVTDIDLAWLNGDIIVRSDTQEISNMAAINFQFGEYNYPATNVATYTKTFTMVDTNQYTEAGTPASDGTLNFDASADITGHLARTNTINMGDSGSATNVDTLVGTTGTITLKAGDADDDDAIDIDDATLIGGNIGESASSEEDINGDGAINILDLVHVGRNYGSTIASCGTGS